MCRVRYIMSNDMREKINNLNTTDSLKNELIKLYKSDPVLTENIMNHIIDTNSFVLYVEVTSLNNTQCVNCIVV